MMNIYFDDNVQAIFFVHSCSTLEEAKDWISEQLKGYTMVDADHPCTENVITSSKTALYQVFDGKPVTIGKDGFTNFAEPIYTSDYFYTI